MIRAVLLSLLAAQFIVACAVGLYAADRINQWERAHGYPYGRLCDAFHSCQR